MTILGYARVSRSISSPYRQLGHLSGAYLAKLLIPTKPAMHSNMKPATFSDPKPAGVPI